MATAAEVGTLAKQIGVGTSRRGARIASAALLGAFGAALLFLLGSAWFATSAGTDYPEPVAAVAE
jgi:hypothetical protein